MSRLQQTHGLSDEQREIIATVRAFVEKEIIPVAVPGAPDGATVPCVSISVVDQGTGMTPEVQEHIFEPFYSASAQGTGLGLFISRELCECNRARLSYRPRAGGGTSFRISFADASRWVI